MAEPIMIIELYRNFAIVIEHILLFNFGRFETAESEQWDSDSTAAAGGRGTSGRMVYKNHSKRTPLSAYPSNEPCFHEAKHSNLIDIIFDQQITTLATAIVGAWKMDIDTKSTSTSEALCYTLPQPIYILFNPWCKGK